jgi:hypothetical protein
MKGIDRPTVMLPVLSEVKDDVHSVLRISSAHNKRGLPDINIAQILHL